MTVWHPLTIQITSDSSDVVPQEHQVQVQVQAQVTTGLSPSSMQHWIYYLRGKCATQNLWFLKNRI